MIFKNWKIAGLFLFLAVFTANAQDREERSLDSFNRLRVGEGIKVELRKGTSEKAIIEVRGMDIEDVETEVRGGTLQISLAGNHHRHVDVEIELTYRSLNSIGISSAANVTTSEPIESDNLFISAASAGSGDLEVKVKELDLEASSAGTLNIYGTAIEVDVEVASAGSIDAYDLEAEEVAAKASSAGSIKVQASKLIDASASSGGSIRYRGNPAKEYTNSSSGGSVRKSG